MSSQKRINCEIRATYQIGRPQYLILSQKENLRQNDHSPALVSSKYSSSKAKGSAVGQNPLLNRSELSERRKIRSVLLKWRKT